MMRRPTSIVLLLAFVTVVMLAETAGGWTNLFLVVLVIGAAAFVFRILIGGSRAEEPKTRPRQEARPLREPTTSRRSAEMQSSSPLSSLERASPGLSLQELIALVAPALLRRSGSVFYSGRAAFQRPSPVYLLGLNPGGSPVGQGDETIGRDLEDWQRLPEVWSAYADESWQGKPPGTCGLQPRVLHLLRQSGLDPRRVPASNVVFVRSSTEANLAGEKSSLLDQCWPVHQAVIERLRVRIIICLGSTAGSWVREQLNAHRLVDDFRESNDRGWCSRAHANKEGTEVLTLTHPSRADWTNPSSDPSAMVIRALQRTGVERSGTLPAITARQEPGTEAARDLVAALPQTAPAIRSAQLHLLEIAARANLRAEPYRSAISAVKLYDRRDRYLFSWIINPHHLLFYIRKPALNLAPYVLRAAEHEFRGAKVNKAGEVTIRIETLADAQALTAWLFHPHTWSSAKTGGDNISSGDKGLLG